jgi:hypothetical protein
VNDMELDTVGHFMSRPVESPHLCDYLAFFIERDIFEALKSRATALFRSAGSADTFDQVK